MKQIYKYYILATLIMLIFSCGGSGDEIEKTNTAPTVPILKFPTDNLLCINNVLDFSWNTATDKEGHLINYELNVATDNQFNNNVYSGIIDELTKNIALNKGVAYYWRVKAIDTQNLSSEYSSTWKFYTEGIGQANHFPFLPTIIKPTLESTIVGNSTTLEWSAVDADSGDTLKYNVYFGTTNTPSLVSGNQYASIYMVTSLSANTYYWKIDVIDLKGAKTVGQIWSFTVGD